MLSEAIKWNNILIYLLIYSCLRKILLHIESTISTASTHFVHLYPTSLGSTNLFSISMSSFSLFFVLFCFCSLDFTYNSCDIQFFSLWLSSFSITPSKVFPCCHNAWQESYVWTTFHCTYMCMSCLFHLPAGKCSGSFHILAVVNSAAVNMGVNISFHISVFISFR